MFLDRFHGVYRLSLSKCIKRIGLVYDLIKLLTGLIKRLVEIVWSAVINELKKVTILFYLITRDCANGIYLKGVGNKL